MLYKEKGLTNNDNIILHKMFNLDHRFIRKMEN